MRKLWQDITASEVRVQQMSVLKGKKLGFQEIELFGLGLKQSFKSEKMREQNDKAIEKVIEAAMSVKIKDERYHQRELHRRGDNKKKRLGEQHHPKTRKYKKTRLGLQSQTPALSKVQQQ